MPNEPNALATVDGNSLDAALETGAAGFQLKTMQDVFRYGQYVIKAGMAPKCYEQAGQIVVAIQTGAETGLSASASIRAIYVVPDSGTPSWTAEAMRGLVRRGFFDPFTRTISSVLHPGTDLEEGVVHTHEETDLKKDCTPQCYGFMRSWPKLKEGQMVETRFTVGMAMQANLWEAKPNPKKNWRLWPFLMLQHRAASIHCRLNYGGVLLGLQGQDEAEDHSFSTVPRVRGGAIDTGTTKGTGDPLFDPLEPIVDVSTIQAKAVDPEGVGAAVSEPSLGVPVNEPPKEETPGPLFSQPGMEEALQDRLAKRDEALEQGAGDAYKGDFCPEHLDNPRDDCALCCDVRMDADKQAAILAELEAKDAER